MKYFLTSERLGFRNWTAEDEPLALELWCDPEVTKFIGGPWSAEVARARLALEIELMNQHGVQYWPVFLLEDGRHVGCAGLRPYSSEQKTCEMGIHLRPGFWGQGFAREAAYAVMNYAFRSTDADALITGHHPENAASRQLLKRLGFGFIEDRLYAPTGLMHPMYLLRRERAVAGQAALGNLL